MGIWSWRVPHRKSGSVSWYPHPSHHNVLQPQRTKCLSLQSYRRKTVLHPLPTSLILHQNERQKNPFFSGESKLSFHKAHQEHSVQLLRSCKHLPSFIHFLYFPDSHNVLSWWQIDMAGYCCYQASRRAPGKLNLKHYCNGKISCGWKQSQRCLFEQRCLN